MILQCSTDAKKFGKRTRYIISSTWNLFQFVQMKNSLKIDTFDIPRYDLNWQQDAFAWYIKKVLCLLTIKVVSRFKYLKFIVKCINWLIQQICLGKRGSCCTEYSFCYNRQINRNPYICQDAERKLRNLSMFRF